MESYNSLGLYKSLILRLHHDIAQCYTEPRSVLESCPCGCDSHLPTNISRQIRLDYRKLLSRLEHEGLQLFTVTLPSMGKRIDYALSSEEPLSIPGIQKIPGTQLPKLFGWLLQRVFTGCGKVRSDADPTALKHARQLVYFIYKLELPYERTTNEKVISSFIQNQEELRQLVVDPNDPIIKRARTFVCRLFNGLDPRNILPRHGPGAVSTGEEVGAKCKFSRIFKSAEGYYPFTGYFTLGGSHIVDRLQWLGQLEELETGTAKVVLVPKDSRGPRLISMEPLENQWLQQGQLKAIVPWLEKHRLTRGHVNFTHQSINRSLALAGSVTGDWVTMDMKDASDRVSLRLVEELFSGTEWLEALKATRSSHTVLPDGTIEKLETFAPMGSAVCFPIEAVCFYALACAALVHEGDTWRQARDSIFVYGDDIITRRENYSALLQHFPRFGLKFNPGKCCVAGFFRESCGCDAFKGVDVTPIRLRTTWSDRRCRDAGELLSYVEASNSLWRAGYNNTAELIRAMVTDRYGRLPFIPDQSLVGGKPPLASSGLDILDGMTETKSMSPSKGMIAWVRPHLDHRFLNRQMRCSQYHTETHRMRLRTWVVGSVTKEFPNLDGWQELLRTLLCGSRRSFGKSIYALPRRTRLKRGWIVPDSYELEYTPVEQHASRYMSWKELGSYTPDEVIIASTEVDNAESLLT